MKKGFTLAELLITVAIIGVIAILTIPAILSEFGKHTWEAGIKKAYNSLAETIELYMADEGTSRVSDTSLANNQEGLREFVGKYYRVVKDCGERYYDPNGKACFAKEYSSLDKSDKTNMAAFKCMLVVNTSDNMSFCFDSGVLAESAAGADVNGDGVTDEKDLARSMWNAEEQKAMGYAMIVEVDVNGPKGPNIMGRDLFQMYVMDNGTIGDPTYDESKRDQILATYTKHAWAMPIGIIQADGWKMTY